MGHYNHSSPARSPSFSKSPVQMSPKPDAIRAIRAAASSNLAVGHMGIMGPIDKRLGLPLWNPKMPWKARWEMLGISWGYIQGP